MRSGTLRPSARLRRFTSLLAAFVSAAAVSACTGLVTGQHDRPAANMIVHHMNPGRVAHHCGAHMSAHRAQALGCAIGDERLCLVFLPHKASVGLVAYERLYRHERAHCNGWRH